MKAWLLGGCASALAIVSVTASAQAQADAQAQVPGEAQSSAEGGTARTTPEAAESAQSGEIVVTGIRRSVQQSLNEKRLANVVADIITAEDIGKLPDQNIAESLSRVPGVQIQRRDGTGSTFTVRGISQNLIEINGRRFVGPSENGQPALEALNPEILSGIEVIKSPSADMREGALGAIVNLKTKRPLDLKDLVLSGRLEGAYGNQVKDFGFRTSGLISTKLFDDTLGVLVSAAYTDQPSRGYGFSTSGWTVVNTLDVNGDGRTDPGLFRPNRTAQEIFERKDRRLTLNGAVQWRPSKQVELLAEATYSDFERARSFSAYQTLLNNNITNASVDATTGTITSARVAGVTLRPLVYDAPTKFETLNLGLSGKFTTEDDRLEVSLDGSYSRGKGNDGQPGSNFTYVVVPRDGRVVNLNYAFLQGNGFRNVPSRSFEANFDLTDPNQYRLLSIFDGFGRRDNEGYDARLDVTYKAGWGPIASLKAGGRYEKLTLFIDGSQNLPTAAALLPGRDRNGDGILTVDELPGLAYDNSLGGDYFPTANGVFPRRWLTGRVDPEIARRDFNLPLPTAFGPVTLGPVSVVDLEQKSYAGYGMANLEGTIGGVSFRGNAGLRYVRTERVSRGFLSATQPTSTGATFNNWLPSGNLTFDLSDDLLLRFAAAKVFARPELNLLGAGYAPNTTNNTGNRGNPRLRPFEATQYDATIEWYFQPASILSAALFRKEVKSFTVVTVTREFIPGFSERFGLFDISQPQNGGDGRVQGFEINYQHAFTFLPGPLGKLGVQANYTRADSKTPIIDQLTQRSLPLPLLSKDSYSLVGYYDDGRLSARLAYTWRSDYLVQVQGAANAGSRYADAYGQLDASAFFNLTDNVRVTFEAVNLTRNAQRLYDGVERRIASSSLEETRFFFGIAASL